MIVLQILCRTIYYGVQFLQFCMLVRAILSWFPPSSGQEGPIRAFFTTVTEFVVAPVRAFLSRFEFARRTPVDISFFITYLLLILIAAFLPMV